eukprot:scaffold168055_cov20-Prasinocladus_malaysianus.AAC.2
MMNERTRTRTNAMNRLCNMPTIRLLPSCWLLVRYEQQFGPCRGKSTRTVAVAPIISFNSTCIRIRSRVERAPPDRARMKLRQWVSSTDTLIVRRSDPCSSATVLVPDAQRRPEQIFYSYEYGSARRQTHRRSQAQSGRF